ncbi:BTB domain transcription factor, putative [Pediculus humanus corporis]|uniref:BTB domain transcription factor, putative n=1 Tax=Pediculus humanus subsp. corporis TaxID=121224 RepID=E0VN44_PEDHC|nr:BTB domain transcription factor, putative [Pediculus humanus corporis]EEB14810.1 BTB domain transcription factor, putative [Pediculus humanus corporis]
MEGNDNSNSKQYSLRWEKHAFNLASEAGCFFEDESFLDCTLSAEGQCIDAHKIILSASSSYLSNLLKIMPDKHPILIFNDIKFEQLKSLVAFIYNGSVNVSENNIHGFLNAAQSLLIKGLSEETKEENRRNVENSKKNSNFLTDVNRTNHSRRGNVKNLQQQHHHHHHHHNHPPPPPPLHSPSLTGTRKSSEFPIPDNGKNIKRQRGWMTNKTDGIECEESLSKLQEISFTKYINQNLNSKSHIRNDVSEHKWNGPADDKYKCSENYVVRSWKHNSMEDINGRHKQNKNNIIKRIKIEKQIGNSGAVGAGAVGAGAVGAGAVGAGAVGAIVNQTNDYDNVSDNKNHLDKPNDDKIKKEIDPGQILLVEPKQEITEEDEEEEDDDGEGEGEETNNCEDGFGHVNVTGDTINSDTDSIYDGRPLNNFYQQPVVDRGIPVPLLMCRTSLSEPETVEPDWMSHISNNHAPSEPSPHTNSSSSDVKDLQCRSCAQELPCPTCTKKYKSRYALNRHILYECGKARKSFSCDECGKKVTRQDTLQKHKLIHLVQHLKKKENETDEESSKPKKSC